MKTETIKTKLEKVTRIDKTEYFCDVCKKDITECQKSFNDNHFRLENQDITRYPDDSIGYHKRMYFCENCFNVIWDDLVKNGATFEEIDY